MLGFTTPTWLSFTYLVMSALISSGIIVAAIRKAGNGMVHETVREELDSLNHKKRIADIVSIELQKGIQEFISPQIEHINKRIDDHMNEEEKDMKDMTQSFTSLSKDIAYLRGAWDQVRKDEK